MGPEEALSLMLVMLPLAAMPSASVALVVARSVGGGRVSGLFAVLGVVLGDVLFVAMALIGMSVLADWLGAFFSVIKYCAGGYLIWLGIGLLRCKPRVAVGGTRHRASSLAGDFLAGLFLTLGDVKAILFYASLFPALVDMEGLGAWEIVLLTGITVITVGGVKLVYALFASELVDKVRGAVASETPRRLGGVLMMGCGSALIVKV